MRISVALAAILLSALGLCEQNNAPPTTMTKMVVRLSGPSIKPRSHGALPRTIYRAGAHYARIEDPPDARQQVQKLIVIAEPNAYSVNLIDKKGTHATDLGGPNDMHLPIVLPFDPKRRVPELDRLEFGDEFAFFQDAHAKKELGPIINAKPTDSYVIDAANGRGVLIVKSGTETPIKLSWQTTDGSFSYEYIEYEDKPFDPALFAKPAGIAYKEVPPDDSGSENGP